MPAVWITDGPPPCALDLGLHATVISGRAAHTVGVRCGALTAATILADAAVTPTVSEMTCVEWDFKPYSAKPSHIKIIIGSPIP